MILVLISFPQHLHRPSAHSGISLLQPGFCLCLVCFNPIWKHRMSYVEESNDKSWLQYQDRTQNHFFQQHLNG